MSRFHNALAVLLLFTSASLAQSPSRLSLEDCYRLARNNYPLIQQTELITKSSDYSLANASKGFLPQVNINGQATYQSAVTTFPGASPVGNVPVLSKDQYKIYGEVNQPLTDSYAIKHQKEWIKANADTDQQQLEVELYKLQERINQLFFGILLMDAQREQAELLKKDIRSGIDKTAAAIANGTALKSSQQILEAELLKAEQSVVTLQANRQGFSDMLSLFIQQPIDEKTVLVSPEPRPITQEINRPELRLFETQKKALNIQTKLVTARNIPRLSLFFQGGYGRPTLNFLSNDFDFYYLGGLRLAWNLSGLYTSNTEQQILHLNQNSLDIQRNVFVFNTRMQLKQQSNDIEKMQNLIEKDLQIISLRKSIKTTANSQLENGSITPYDYVTTVNAEDQASQNLLTHQIQLLLAQYTYQTTSGN